jgi:DNA mismatch endonuclease (patch repair protein)
MADVHSKETRSFNMSRIRGSNTKPELLVRRYLFRRGFRYRLHAKSLSGKPDMVLPAYRTVIFVHGCFWHGHEGCRYFTIPKTRTEWWQSKITVNKNNDMRSKRALEDAGWLVLEIWECELKKAVLDSTMMRVVEQLTIRKLQLLSN